MALWLADRPLVLASRSAGRRKLLQAAGIPLELRAADLDERAVEGGRPLATASERALLLAEEKARAVAKDLPERVVLGADQTLSIGKVQLSKPRCVSAARDQLKDLRGETHALHSAIAVVCGSDLLFTHVSTARLTMRNFSDQFLDTYLAAAGSSVATSVGGYEVEGMGIHLFEHMDGAQSTIMGLPMLPLLEFLRRQGLLAQ